MFIIKLNKDCLLYCIIKFTPSDQSLNTWVRRQAPAVVSGNMSLCCGLMGKENYFVQGKE